MFFFWSYGIVSHAASEHGNGITICLNVGLAVANLAIFSTVIRN